MIALIFSTKYQLDLFRYSRSRWLDSLCLSLSPSGCGWEFLAELPAGAEGEEAKARSRTRVYAHISPSSDFRCRYGGDLQQRTRAAAQFSTVKVHHHYIFQRRQLVFPSAVCARLEKLRDGCQNLHTRRVKDPKLRNASLHSCRLHWRNKAVGTDSSNFVKLICMDFIIYRTANLEEGFFVGCCS